ncbi:MAG TPA: DUF981 domain-containing protein [bacterium]|nr:DUF981 domain-containing protein [bacterium]
MFIDYLTLMLINMVAGLVLLAAWIFLDVGTPGERRWVPGMLMAGFLALATGLHMIFTWPLVGSYNILYGEMSVFYGILLVGVGFTVMMGLDLLPVAIYAEFVGLAAVLIGIQVLKLDLTQHPTISGVGFIWMGLVGLGAVPMLRMRSVPAFRIFGAAGLLIAAVIWGVTGYMAYWGHVKPFAKWKPVHMQYEMQMNNPQ